MNTPEAEVWLTEGEKDTDNLLLLDLRLPVSSFKNWRQTYSQYIKGAHAVLFRDHDVSGVNQANDAARIIAEVAASVKVIDLFVGEPLSEKHGKDVSDWIEARRGEGLENDDIAERLSILVNGHDLWKDTPVDGSAVLDAVEQFIGRFVAYPSEHARIAHTLWIAHTWLMDMWDSTPRIAFLSPEPGSGKSRALEVTEPLVPRAVHAVSTTPAYLFRKVSDPQGPPTILYDEIDTVFGPRAKDNEDVRGMLNAGHRKGATAGRCVVRGSNITTEELPAYCAVALAGLNDLPDTVMSRSVVVRMRRRAPNEKIEPWRSRKNRKEAEPIARKLELWSLGVKPIDNWPEMPEGVEDRNADVWEALLTVADLAGGDWPKRARVAAVALVASAADNTASLGVQLLADLRTVFNGFERLTTDEVIEKLLKLPESAWGDLRGKQLDARGLAYRLRKYELKPKQLRLDGRNVRGYERSDLLDPWSRYLPTENPLTPLSENDATSATSATTAETRAENLADVTDVAGLADLANPVNVTDVADVADETGDDRQTIVGYAGARPYERCGNCGKHKFIDKACPFCGATTET